MLTPTTYRLKKRQLLHLLDELGTACDRGISTYLPSGITQLEIEKMLSIVLKQQTGLPAIVSKVASSTTGAVLFWGEQHRYLILPPFPNNENFIIQGYDVEPLRSLMNRDLTMALILLRMGTYAIGVVRGEKLYISKVGTGLVHSRHKKGGSSQHRYERHRDKQIEFFFSRICTHARELIDPYLKQIDYLYYGGENFTISSFREQCRYLQKLDDRTMKALLNIRKPKQASLEAAIGEAWSSKVIQWQEE